MSERGRLGLGCSRFGSLVRGVDRPAAQLLVRAALDMGVRDFDTANIYGQGDSERFLGEALDGLADVRITTKAGQVFPPLKRAMIPFKRLLKPLVRHGAGARQMVAQARSAELPRNWSSAYLRASLEQSLRRLRRDHVDSFLLHSPDAAALKRGEATATLADLKRDGKALVVGASIDDLAALEAAVADPHVEMIQFPITLAGSPALEEARARGIILVAREILNGASTPEAVDDALGFARAQPVDIWLLGTGSAAHLDHARSILVPTAC